MYHLNIFGSSSSLRKSSDIFGNFRKFSKNVRKRSSGLRDNFGKSSEIFGKASKTPLSVRLYNKKNNTLARRYKFCYSWQEQYLTRSPCSLVRYCSSHSKHKIHIFSPPCNILYVFFTLYGYIATSQSDQLLDGLIAKLVEHCTSIAEVMGLNPSQALISQLVKLSA